MSSIRVCGHCGGTGEVEVLDTYEYVHKLINRSFSLVERGLAERVISLDIEGSYPVAITVERGQSDEEAIEAELRFWPLRGNGLYTHPLNNNGGIYAAPDPRFYDEF